jgi:hypothetical protein
VVRQGGPVRIWDRAERAIGDWREHGSPGVTEFRVQVTPKAQRVYLHAAPDVAWVKPAGATFTG